MPEQSITCPNCGKKIQVTEAFTREIEEKVRRQFEAQSEKLEAAHKTKLKEKEEEYEEKLSQERVTMEKRAKKRAEDAVSVEIQDLTSQLEEKKAQTDSAHRKEIGLLKKVRELEERDSTRELEIQRKLEGERTKIWEQATKAVTEENRLKDADKDKQMAEMRSQIEDLKRKAEQGSQEAQGEVLESLLESNLRLNFPNDSIDPVARGVRGADILQRVRNDVGQDCGTIIWEAKRAKNWSDTWVQKLKDDQREAKADVAAVVATTLPDQVSHVGSYEGIWVADVQSAVGLGSALRDGMIQLARARSALVGKNTKMEAIYNYLSGPAFRQRVEATVEAFIAMQQDLNSERRAMEKVWAKREKQITKVVENTSRMYGDLQGLIGASLPELKVLELPAGEQSDN